MEYIGAVLVAAAVVVVVLSSFAGIDVKAVLGDAVKKVTTGK